MFAQNYGAASSALLGKMLKVNGHEVTILAAEGYPKRENERPPYTPVLTMKPGDVFCPRHRGGILVLIACHDKTGPGGCILLRKILKDGRAVNGPGRVAEALGITEPGARGKITVTKDGLSLAVA